MAEHDGTVELDREETGAGGQDSVDATGESKQVAGTSAPRVADAAREVSLGNLTIETLNRYLTAAADDRDAAEERSSQVITRFTRLTIAMMCLTMVIAGANVAMIIRQSGAAQPAAVAPPRPVETPTVLVQPAQTVPALSEQREPARPAEKIPLLGSPPSARARQTTAPILPRLARTTIAPPRSRPLLSARTVEDDSGESRPTERW
jgi:hypothetical protein